MDDPTTIQVKTETREKLKELKITRIILRQEKPKETTL